MSPDGLRIPIGTLSPLVEGDSLVVETGTITFLDFRNGQNSVFGAGTALKIPEVVDRRQPSWFERLKGQIARCLSSPQRNRIDGTGSVRRGQPEYWPEDGRFAPDVPIVFEWWRARPAPVLLEIRVDGRITELAVKQDKPGSGALTWRPPNPPPSGEVAWQLLTEGREPIGGGRLRILTIEEAEAQRKHFREAANEIEGMPRDLAAAVLATAEGTHLW